MTTPPAPPRNPLAHHAQRMGGRDPHEEHRTATPLELLFDLTFVIAFGLAASQFAHAPGGSALFCRRDRFRFRQFRDLLGLDQFLLVRLGLRHRRLDFRIVTMVQMTGVLVLAIGLPRMFASIEHGAPLDNAIMVLGYVIMRAAMVFQWLRAARQDPPRRRACLTYVSHRGCQWPAGPQIVFDFTSAVTFVIGWLLTAIEMMGPVIAERRDGGTPWHPHHIAERYSLFAIIALGEGVVGTVATLSAAVEEHGWTLDAALVCIAGTGLTFGMWWIYYIMPALNAARPPRPVLRLGLRSDAHRRDCRDRCGPACRRLFYRGQGPYQRAGDRAHRRHSGQRLSAVDLQPLSLSGAAIRFSPLSGELLATAAVVAVAVMAAVSGISMAACLVILMFAPAVTVLGYEIVGHRHKMEAIARAIGKPS